MAVDALARLNHKQKELNDANKHYHDLLVDRDQRIEELEKAVASIKTEQGNLRKENGDLMRDVRGYKETTDAAVKAQKKAEKDLEFQKGVNEFDRKDAEGLQKSNNEKDQKIVAQNKVAVKFQERISEQAATLQGLHKSVDEAEAEKQSLQIANTTLAAQLEGTAKDVDTATKEFEDMFKDLGRDLDLNGYVGHIRDLLGSGQLKRQESSHSLQRQLSPQKSHQEFPSSAGKSLMDQLAAADDASSEHSVPATGDPDDDDETLTALGLAHPFTEYDYFKQLQRQEMRIVELKRLNAELQVQPPRTTTRGTSPIDPLSADATAQTLGFSTIQTLETEPITGESQQRSKVVYVPSRCTKLHAMPPKMKMTRGTSTIDPVSADATTQTLGDSSSTNVLETGSAVGDATNRSGLYQLIFFLLLAANIFLLVCNGTERWVWMSANDTTREAVIRAGSSSGAMSLFSPVMAAMDRLVGMDSALMG